MALAYFIVEGTETINSHKVVDAATGLLEAILYHADTKLWLPEQLVRDWDNTVRHWDGFGQSEWVQKVAEPTAQAVEEATRGYAFSDPSGTYSSLVTFVSTTQAFRRHPYVFVPDGVQDPRSGEVVNQPTTPTPIPSFMDDDEEEEEETQPEILEPSTASMAASWALILGIGAATAYVVSKIAGKYL